MDKESLIGKTISYHWRDEISDETMAFTIKEVKFNGRSYGIKGKDGQEYLTFTIREIKKLITDGRTERRMKTGGLSVEETYTITD